MPVTRPSPRTARAVSLVAGLLVALLLLALLAGCRPTGPRPIAVGEDECGYCRMRISDPRFGAELVSTTGKVHTFDSVECLAGFYLQQQEAGRVRSVWVSDFHRPGTFIPAEQARYLIGAGPSSPMGAGIVALAPEADVAAAQAELGGRPIGWADVVAHARRQLASTAPADPHAAHAHAEAADAPGAAPVAGEVVVSPDGRLRTLAEAVRRAPAGGRIRVRPGVYRESTVVVERPMEIVGEPGAVLDARDGEALLVIVADSVTVRGLTLRGVTTSYREDRAAIRVAGVAACTIADNRLEDNFFGIYLAQARDCRVTGNTIVTQGSTESATGNGIHLWSSNDVAITGNRIRGHRDGIYLEFARAADVQDNESAGNLRYGLHFMYSDSSRYTGNLFTRNAAGVAVMYSHAVEMHDNRFVANWGPAAYGLLLKEVKDARITGNDFVGNTAGLLADGADRIVVDGNRFERNGWALRLMASSYDGTFTGNSFVANTFDVATNSRQNYSRFEGNYWDAYRGYDLDRDGTGDVPFRPVRLFSLLVESHEPALILLRSPFVAVLDAAERVLPVLTPETLRDDRPAMRRPA